MRNMDAMNKLYGLIFDVDGVIADTIPAISLWLRVHVPASNRLYVVASSLWRIATVNNDGIDSAHNQAPSYSVLTVSSQTFFPTVGLSASIRTV